MNSAFWRNKNVLVTGHEGFLGSNMTKRLVGAGANVVGLDIVRKPARSLFIKGDYNSFTGVKGSVADYNLVNRLLRDHKIEYVFHIGAEAIVGRCNADPVKCFRSNIEGTWSILEACRHYGKVKAIVVASSDKAYGSHKDLPYHEGAALIGDHPYDVSKSCADLVCYTYFNTYGLPVSVTRCGNIYGPGDFNFSRIVPSAIKCALSGEALLIRSDGKYTRDYVYVDDIVSGYLLIAEKMKTKKLAGEAFNFSDENPMTVIKFVKMIDRILCKKPNYKVLNQAKYEIKHQYLASKKARMILGWKPKYSLAKGLEATIAWYESNLKQS